MGQASAEQALRALDLLVGEWAVEAKGDAAHGTYVQLYSDERGVCRIYTMHIDSKQWILQREGEPFAQRFTGTISGDARTISGRWEKAENGPEFTVDFYLTYRKAASSEP